MEQVESIFSVSRTGDWRRSAEVRQCVCVRVGLVISCLRLWCGVVWCGVVECHEHYLLSCHVIPCHAVGSDVMGYHVELENWSSRVREQSTNI